MPSFKLSTQVLPATCAWVLLFACTAIFFGSASHYLATQFSSLILIYEGLLSVFVIANFGLATFMDPGTYPRAHEDEVRVTESRSSPLYKTVDIDGISIRMKWCATCQFYRPPRCSHCSACNTCIEVFDHHCPWVNNCIGRSNYRYFVFFLISLCFDMISMFAFSLLCVVPNVDNLLTANNILLIILMVIIGIVCLPIVGLTCFHMVLIARGRTTNEQVTGKMKGGNPFNRGCFLNFQFILCGPIWPRLTGRNAKMYTIEASHMNMVYQGSNGRVYMKDGLAALNARANKSKDLSIDSSNGQSSHSSSRDSDPNKVSPDEDEDDDLLSVVKHRISAASPLYDDVPLGGSAHSLSGNPALGGGGGGGRLLGKQPAAGNVASVGGGGYMGPTAGIGSVSGSGGHYIGPAGAGVAGAGYMFGPTLGSGISNMHYDLGKIFPPVNIQNKSLGDDGMSERTISSLKTAAIAPSYRPGIVNKPTAEVRPMTSAGIVVPLSPNVIKPPAASLKSPPDSRKAQAQGTDPRISSSRGVRGTGPSGSSSTRVGGRAHGVSADDINPVVRSQQPQVFNPSSVTSRTQSMPVGLSGPSAGVPAPVRSRSRHQRDSGATSKHSGGGVSPVEGQHHAQGRSVNPPVEYSNYSSSPRGVRRPPGDIDRRYSANEENLAENDDGSRPQSVHRPPSFLRALETSDWLTTELPQRGEVKSRSQSSSERKMGRGEDKGTKGGDVSLQSILEISV